MIGSLIIFVACFIPKAIDEKSMINYHREKLIRLLGTKKIPITGKVKIIIQSDSLVFTMEEENTSYSFPIKKKVNQYIVEVDNFRKHTK